MGNGKDMHPRHNAMRKHLIYYFMLAPLLIWYTVFCYVPMYGVFTAFQDYAMHKGVFGSPFVGLKHFERLLNERLFWRAFRNSAIIAVYRVLFSFPVPILLSILVNELRNRSFKKVSQTVMYLPHFFSWVIVASVFVSFFSPDVGMLAAVLKRLYPGKTILFPSNDNFRAFLIITDIWKEAGWGMIIYLAAMSHIDLSLYEAAYVDGANRFQRVLHITLPSITYLIAIQIILYSGGVLQTGFDQVFNLKNPLIMERGDIIDYYVYRTVTKDFDLSYSAAVGLFSSLISLFLMLFTNFTANKLSRESVF